MSSGRKLLTQLLSFGPHVVSGFEPRPWTKIMLKASQRVIKTSDTYRLAQTHERVRVRRVQVRRSRVRRVS
jgi:hypothetical protein